MSAGQTDQYQKVTSFAGCPPEYSPAQGRGPDWSAAGVRKESYPAQPSQRSFNSNPLSSNSPSHSTPTLSTPRKRTRSFTMDTIPSLPKITGDIILEVFTHRTLRFPGAPPASEEYGDNERLAELGAKALDTAVTYALFCKRPMLTAAELKTEAAEVISDSNVDHWLTVYRLRDKVRCTPDVVSGLKSPQEGRLLFTSYVGAVFAQCGMVAVQGWISQLIEPPPEKSNDPDLLFKRVKNEPTPLGIPPQQPPLSSPAYALHQAHYNPSIPSYSQMPPQPSQPPPPLPNTPQNQPISFLPMFNQTANQRRLGVEYQAQFFGPPHAGRWTVKCMVNGLEKGQGTGSSKQLAKEEAARQAFYAMGWAAN